MTEQDYEWLEAYLDGALPLDEAHALWRRLGEEPELAAVLADLRGARDLRALVWQACEPDEATIARISARCESAMRRGRFLERARRGLMYAVGVAACVILGMNLNLGHRGAQSPSNPYTQTIQDHTSYPVAVRDASGNVLAVRKFDSLDEARQFIEDVNNQQTRQQQSRDSNILPVSADEPF